MLEILSHIQSDVKLRLQGVEGRLEGVEGRLQLVGVELRKTRRESAGMMVLMRSAAGTFEERVTGLEEDMRMVKERLGIAE